MGTGLALSMLAGCAKGSGSKEAFCGELRSVPEPSTFFGGLDPGAAGAVKAADRRTSDQLQKLERAAPRQIKPDVSAMADLEAEIADLALKYRSNQSVLRTKLIELGQQRVGAATSVIKVGDYARTQCGIDLAGRSRRGTLPALPQSSATDDTAS